MRAIRGAICAENTKESILTRTRELLDEIFLVNGLEVLQVVAITFTCTKDLDAVYPAQAAREAGILEASLMCVAEMDAQGSMQGIVRVQMLVEMDVPQSAVRHVYLGRAAGLRPDLAGSKE